MFATIVYSSLYVAIVVDRWGSIYNSFIHFTNFKAD